MYLGGKRWLQSPPMGKREGGQGALMEMERF